MGRMRGFGLSDTSRERSAAAKGANMLTSISNFFRGLFGRKADNFKDLLMADLGIER